jgi:hypothetical protein
MLALLLAAGVISTTLFVGGGNASARGRGVGEDILTDGSFESVTAASTGDWVYYTGSAQGAGGTIAVEENVDASGEESAVINASDGVKSIHITAGTSQWPEIYQIIAVEKNTDYYITLELRNNDKLLTAKTNVFYGFANTDPAENVDIHQQQRWIDKSTKDFQVGVDPDFTPLKAVLNTGNYTQVRFFLRANAANINVDNVTIAKSEPILPPDTVNLLKQPGFEGGAAQLASVWKPFGTGNAEEGEVRMGYDDYKTDADYKPAVKIQNKEIEGYKCLWIAYYAGATENDTYGIYQDVAVEANTTYTFYVNLSKFKTIGRAEIGVYGANSADEGSLTTVISRVRLADSNLYCSCYNLYSVTINSGENTTVRPYILLTNGTDASWAWGAGLLVDDLYFFHSANGDVPADQTNLFADPDFEIAENQSPWAFTSLGGENGLNVGAANNNRGYNSPNDAWINHWSANGGISQLVTLEAGKDYKITARVKVYHNQWWTIKGAFSIAVYDENTLLVDKAQYNVSYIHDAIWSTGSNKDTVTSDNVWFPVALTFNVPADGEYEVFFGFLENSNGEYYGGLDLSAPALYEAVAAVEPELDPPVIQSSDAAVTVGTNAVTVTGDITVSALKAALSVNVPYTLRVVNASGAAVDNAATVATGYKVLVLNGEETVATYTVTVSSASNPPDGCSGCGSSLAVFPAVLALGLIAIFLKKKF